MDIKKSLKDVLVLSIICIIFAGALAATNMLTKDTIKAKREAAENKAYESVMPNAAGFETIDLTKYQGISETVVAIKKETSGQGYAIKLETTGYKPGLVIIIAVGPDGTVMAATCVSSNETWGDENKMNTLVIGKDASTVLDVEAGATGKTINAYKNAVRDALNALIILSGEKPDERTEAEIFEDNLEAAIGDEEADFETINFVGVKDDGDIYTLESLGISSVHKATNGKGHVIVMGKTFIGIDTEGNVIGEVEVDDETKATIANVLDLINAADEDSGFISNASTYENVDISEYKSSTEQNLIFFQNINYVKKNANGTYLMKITVSGYNTKVKIVMLVTFDADGKVVDNLAVSHAESAKFGAVQFKDGVYNILFNGKTEVEAGNVDTVANVTVSTEAYKYAILDCFKAYNIIKGGAN